MSYRTIKRLMGETNLERKCRFLFGGGLMLLITGSFYFYSTLNAKLVREQNRTTAQLLVAPILMEKHWKWEQRSSDMLDTVDRLVRSFKSDELKDYNWRLWSADPLADPQKRPDDVAAHEALAKIRRGDKEVIDIVSSKGEYNYYREVRAEKLCLGCHRTRRADDVDLSIFASKQEKDAGEPADSRAPAASENSQRLVEIKENDLIGMAKVTLPLARTEKALAWNNAILIATAIVTAFLATLAAYAIVRYVIVKPVLHLKEVSDGIARGTLGLRADIHTGDEFEELSHAFNRMLRHLVTVQDELREVNTDLDGKVDELAQVNLRLYELNKLKDEFLATMSHELRTPLNSILGFSDVLSAAPNLNDRQKRFLNNIQTSGNQLMVLINDLLDLAKIESGKMEVQPVEFSIVDVVERQVNSLLPMAEKKHIAVTTEIDPQLTLLFQDVGKLQQILNNLLSNAIKFTPEGGRVRVRAVRTSNAFMEFIVEDTGVGIALDDQATIFEKFRQGKTLPGQRDTMTREYGGTGLGLSIVKELTRLLEGDVTLESEFGKGSTFTIKLPIRLDESKLRLERDLRQQSLDAPRLTTADLKPRLLAAAGSKQKSPPAVDSPAVDAPAQTASSNGHDPASTVTIKENVSSA